MSLEATAPELMEIDNESSRENENYHVPSPKNLTSFVISKTNYWTNESSLNITPK